MCLYNGFEYISLYSLTKAASPSSDNIIVLISGDMKGLSRTHNIWIGSFLRHQLHLHTDPVITVYSVPLHFPLYFSMERTVIPSSSCATTYWLLTLFCFPLNITTCAQPPGLSKRLSLAQHECDTHPGPINWNLGHIAHGSSHEDGGYWIPWVSTASQQMSQHLICN